MNDAWAARNLHVIRTLMERAALYRRALAPISLAVGVLGLLAGAGGWALGIASTSPAAFATLWMGVAIVSLAVALLIMRRQALRDAESFWSPPTRRVAEAMTPALSAGFVAGVLACLAAGTDSRVAWWLASAWMVLYGIAAHAAGFFMRRGIKLLGWLFIVTGSGVLAWLSRAPVPDASASLARAHLVMGLVFGGCHVFYGIYLALTETRNATPGS